MKRITTQLLIFSAVSILVACGNPATIETQSSATNAPTQAPAVTQSAPQTGGTQVDVVLADNTIQVSQTDFQVGVPYTFVIVNSGRHAHNFNINTPVSSAGSIDAALSSALLVVDQDQLAVGETATVDFTFPASSVGAPLEFSCLIRRHYEDGMLQAITVSP